MMYMDATGVRVCAVGRDLCIRDENARCVLWCVDVRVRVE